MEVGTFREPSDCDDTVAAGYERDAIQWDRRQDCDVRQILDRIADKWSLLVISLLARRTLRFSELRREIDGISQRMLTLTLRHLERDGLISRTVYPVVPPRVDYELTDLGFELLKPVNALGEWARRNTARVNEARQTFDAACPEGRNGSHF